MTIVVVSPHLDDAVLSIGATLHAAVTRGAAVRVVTVFAGDPERLSAPSYWDAERQVTTAAEATDLRRQEDLAASKVLGFEPVWLAFDDSGYVYHRDPAAIIDAVRPHLDDATVVLVPGWPLEHMDHRYLAMLMIEQQTETPMLMYAELPYAASPRNLLMGKLRGRCLAPLRNALGGGVEWAATTTTRADRAAKRAAVACYRGELDALGYRARVASTYERIVGRELVGTSPALMGQDVYEWSTLLLGG